MDMAEDPDDPKDWDIKMDYRPNWCPLITENDYWKSYADLNKIALKLYENTQKDKR